MKIATALLLSALSLTTVNAFAQNTENTTSLTIYSKAQPGSIPPAMYRPTPNNTGWANASRIPGYAVIRQQQNISLPQKRTLIKLDDVAAYIDPTTVSFTSITAPDQTSAIEQNFYFDLVSPQKLAQRYIGQTISFEKNFQNKNPETVTGTLLSTLNNQLSVQKEDGTIISTTINNAIFPALPGGLYTKPTLVLDVLTEKTGDHTVQTSYQTEGITWWTDYNAVYHEGGNENSGTIDLGAWVSIVNKSGASYSDAKLKLIAGDVNKIAPQNTHRLSHKSMAINESFSGDVAGFAEKKFFEFHLYTLGRNTTLPNNSTKQIELFSQATHIPVEKSYIYNGNKARFYGGTNYSQNFGQTSNKKVEVYLTFKNEEADGLGIPLPAGRLRVSKQDQADGSLEFIGENTIDHTPKNESIRIKLGNAFDIVGERKQLDFSVDRKRRYMTETIEITLRNHKDSAIEALVAENLNRATNWKFDTTSHEYTKLDAHSVHFPVSVPANDEKKISYTISYTW